MTTFSKLSPVLVVDDAVPCVHFGERLGFAKTAEVPHGDPILVGGSCLFIELDDLESVIRATDSTPVVVARRTTFYGMNEIGVKDPGGHLIMFAQKV